MNCNVGRAGPQLWRQNIYEEESIANGHSDAQLLRGDMTKADKNRDPWRRRLREPWLKFTQKKSSF